MDFYLTSPVLPDGVFRLGSKVKRTIGRAAENDISLPSGEVSRRHAEIVPAAAGHRIFDLGSNNGTRVNGEEVGVEGTPLLDGDEIELGPFVLTYQEFGGKVDVLRDQARAAQYDDTTAVGAVRPGALFSASFTGGELREMCALLAEGKKDGTVHVVGDGVKGRLLFSAGKLVGAEGPGTTPIQRATSLLSLTRGTFELAETLLPEDQARTHDPPLPLRDILAGLK